MISYIEKLPTPEEFNLLYEAVGWGTIDTNIIDTALKNTVYSICVYDDSKIIGYGRIIGDKTMLWFCQAIKIKK